MSLIDFISRLALALLLGTVIGFERQWRLHLAGLRTNTLVSVGSALFILLSLKLTGDASATGRIAGQIIVGIGFLGAGVIMKDGFSVHGLNTAATLWCSSAVGSLAGFGFWEESSIAAGTIVLIHLVQRPIANLINRRPVKFETYLVTYQLKVTCRLMKENDVRIIMIRNLTEEAIEVRSIRSITSRDPGNVDIQAEIYASGKQNDCMERLISALSVEKDVVAVSWEITGHNSD
jgi:putative Mg2+ transporter-C (MgtC) family protein